MMKSSFCILISLLFCKTHFAQTINYLDSSQKGVSYRGLSVVTDNIFWVSGSKGTVGKTLDGGKHFTWVKPRGFEKTDFRDVEAFDDKTAVIMGIDSPGVILKTIDGGANWRIVYRNETHGIFLDAMAFKNDKRGVCLGDPIADKFWLVETNDSGDTWTDVPIEGRPTAAKGEACFASSGTNIQFLNDPNFEYGFVTGGMNARFFKMGGSISKLNAIIDLPLMKGQQPTGANSLAVNGLNLFVVGGDFTKFKRNDSTAVYSNGVVSTFNLAEQHPFGYKSCAIYKDNATVITAGLSGIDILLDDFKYWTHFDLPFHVVQKAKKGQAVYLAGGNGRIAKIIF